jgi:hypothetical protein
MLSSPFFLLDLRRKEKLIGLARKMKPIIRLSWGHCKKNPGFPWESGRPGSVGSRYHDA